MDIRLNTLPESVGRYELVRELGHGATATVFLARDPFAGREVAVKVFPHAPGDPGLTRGTHRASFLNEASLVGKLHHPHIVALLDAGVEPRFSYVAMEYVQGGTLSQHAAADKLLPLERVIELGFKLGRALEYAQRQGVIHRDIKPANVLLTQPFDVKLSDFGVARIESATHTEITGIGSPAYMSPEQLTDLPLNHQSDIYSLGVVMYQMLAGRLPFHATSVAELMQQIVNREAPRLRSLRAELPEAVEAIVSRAMQKDLRLRYQSWLEFGRDLAGLARGLTEPSEDLSDARKFHALRDLSFFTGFSEIAIWETLRFATWSRVPAGTAIIEEGGHGDSIYILVEGRVEVTRAGTHLATLGAGDLFGVILYFADDIAERSTTVRSIGQAAVLEIKAAALNSASEACQVQFNKACMRLLVERLSQVDQRPLAPRG
ncbi:MAG TPA: serine/threonine-protein kinase [Burkholderiales bacterium]|nr:serine/threonine-protein kinase [Burkholderiales bacterium]